MLTMLEVMLLEKVPSYHNNYLVRNFSSSGAALILPLAPLVLIRQHTLYMLHKLRLGQIYSSCQIKIIHDSIRGYF